MIGDQIGRDNPGRWIAHLAEAMDIRHHGIPFYGKGSVKKTH